jgi:hypothetical protein
MNLCRADAPDEELRADQVLGLNLRWRPEARPAPGPRSPLTASEAKPAMAQSE